MARYMTPLGAITRGVLAAAVGTAAMDLQQYLAYRRTGGTENFPRWEFGGIENWDQVSGPGQAGEKIIRGWTGRRPDPKWAGLTNNVMHWGFGLQGGAVYGIVAGSTDPPPLRGGLSLAVLIWLFGYAVLPLAQIYKPIWQYDPRTLAGDLGSHLLYGSVTGVVFRLLAGR